MGKNSRNKKKRKIQNNNNPIVAPPKSNLTVSQTVKKVEKYSGPIPPPEALKKYQDIDGSFPERIMGNWEKQTQHRHNVETKAIDANITVNKRSQWFAFTISLCTLSIAGYAIYVGQFWVGGIFAIFPIAMLAINLFNSIYQLFQKKN